MAAIKSADQTNRIAKFPLESLPADDTFSQECLRLIKKPSPIRIAIDFQQEKSMVPIAG